jgi:hypothetical protein
MPTLGTQTISSSFAQLLKTFTTGGLDGALQVVTDGDNTSSALSLSTSGVSSTGSFSVDGASTLTGAVTFGTNITASTGTATIGTLSVGTATISTATISTATIPNILGVSTFATGFTSSTGTNTLGTIASTTINNTGLATVGTLEIGGLAGPKITNVSYGTFAFSGGTVQTHAANDSTTGTFGLPCQLGDIVIASIDSLGSTTGTGALIATNFFPIATDVVEYNIIGKGTTAGTIPAGTIFATALRFTA